MDNHYHLLIETPDANLSKGMRHLNGVYTQKFNRSHDRVGHLFQGRFNGILVEKDSYLLELVRYIVLNPVRSGFVKAAADWRWSSHGVYLKDKPCGPVQPNQILGFFSNQSKVARQRYLQFVSEGISQPSPMKKLKQNRILGSDEFAKQVLSRIADDLEEVPRPQRSLPAKALKQYEAETPSRNKAIVMAYDSGEYTMKAIAEYFGLHYSTVSRIVKRRMWQ